MCWLKLHYTSTGDVPTIRGVTVHGSNVIEVEWELPYPTQAIIKFIVFVSVSDNEERQISVNQTDAITAWNVTGLQPLTRYTFTVAAVFVNDVEGMRSQPIIAATTAVIDDTTPTSKPSYLLT